MTSRQLLYGPGPWGELLLSSRVARRAGPGRAFIDAKTAKLARRRLQLGSGYVTERVTFTYRFVTVCMHTHTIELGKIQVVVNYDSTRFDDRRLSLTFDCSSTVLRPIDDMRTTV